MITFRNSILIFSLSLVIALTGCNKDDTTIPSNPDPSVYSGEMIKNYQAATKNDPLSVQYHQQALHNGNHDSCYIYVQMLNQYDSLFSLNFYQYCRTIYANNGGKNYDHDGWNWNFNNGGWNQGNWQCGLDTLQFQNWNGYGDCMTHDRQMYLLMQGYGMTGYFSSQANQCFFDMQTLRENHYQHHDYHW
ncbi:MAG TPA: hypothetical protein PK711_02490 [Bacteroidales bacterium]|nr:hypothetical protein [Bacteroidales bacterium]